MKFSALNGVLTGCSVERLRRWEVGPSAESFSGAGLSWEQLDARSSRPRRAGHKPWTSCRNVESKPWSSSGGNGSQQGAFALSEAGFPVVGVASTIDNDLAGSDITIGVDTALNIALEAIDRLKVTASSHQRGLVVEVMGRDCGYLALIAGITGGAEAVAIPERPISPEAVAREFQTAYKNGKQHALAVVAEGAECNAEALSRYFREQSDLEFEIRGRPFWDTCSGAGPQQRLTGSSQLA